MKIEELKHNHSLTDLLKILLFAILMLAPALSVASRCLYVIANKNAYQSYTSASVEMKSETLSLVEGVEYYYGYTGNTTGQTNNTSILIEINTCSEELNPNTIYIRFNNAGKINEYDSTQTLLGQIDATYCTYSVKTAVNLVSQPWFKNYAVVYTEQKLDNVFEYSVSKLATDQMFTWTQNTPVFTGVQAMCTQLGITAPAIPIIIAYWLILTCVYIVIDIVIKLITYITHLIGARKGA